jgi:hypothetical protein
MTRRLLLAFEYIANLLISQNKKYSVNFYSQKRKTELINI